MAERTVHETLEEARKLVKARRPKDAVAIGRQVLRYFPQYLEAYRLLGEACLAAGDYQGAVDCFRRVLSADPESLAAHMGLGMIFEDTGEYAEALWHWERAFEIAPGNQTVREHLHRLYTWRDGGKTPQMGLTRAALGRLYARNGQLRRAIAEYKALLAEDPERVDVQVALAEALWRARRYDEAAEVSHDLLSKVPYCLKANLLLGALSSEEDREGRACLSVAQALDPENRTAQRLLGPESPLPPREIPAPFVEVLPLAEEATPAPRPQPEGPPRRLHRQKPLWRRLIRRLTQHQADEDTAGQ